MATRKSKHKISNSLLDAVKFVGLPLKLAGAPPDLYCMMQDGWMCSCNGVVSLGMKVPQQLTAAPHNAHFEAALDGCADVLQIAQLAEGRLHVSSGDWQAYVPCCPADELERLTWPVPDPALVVVTDDLRAAIVTAGTLANPKAQSVLCASVVLNNGSCIATNNTCII